MCGLSAGQNGSSRAWNARYDTYRLRVFADVGRDVDGKAIGARICLRLNPTKNYPTGTRGTLKTFIIDDDPRSLSAGRVIRDMLVGDPAGGDLHQVPLFRDTGTGKELSYRKAAAAFRIAVKKVGLGRLSSGLYTLRVGGATAYANARGEGGDMVAAFMGGWRSEDRRMYLWTFYARLDMMATKIARANGGGVLHGERPWGRLGTIGKEEI